MARLHAETLPARDAARFTGRRPRHWRPAPLLVALLSLGLAACSSGVPVERQVVVPGGNFAAVQGEARLTVRTFLPESGGTRGEVIGADCTVLTSLYSARLVTPSRLVVPNFGPQSPEITVDCKAGALTGSATVRVFTNWQYAPGPWGPYGGYYGPYGPWGWGGAAGYPLSEYPDVAVTLR